jgi:hypothetical protein
MVRLQSNAMANLCAGVFERNIGKVARSSRSMLYSCAMDAIICCLVMGSNIRVNGGFPARRQPRR